MNLFRLLPVLVLFDCALPVTQTIWQVAKVEQYEAAIADITGIPAESVNVVLSPDGQTLAWMKDEHTLCLYPFANEQTRCVSPPNQAVLPLELTWSRDQHYLSLYGYSTSGYALWLYSLKEAVFTPVIENDTSWSGYAPVWAADDAARDETLYYLDLEFKPDDQTWSGAIFSVTPPNLEPQQIFELPPALAASNYLRLAVVSPDGQRLILLSQLHQGMLETDDEISGLWLIDLADRSLSQLASMAELRAGFPRWYQGYFELESVTWNATANGLLINLFGSVFEPVGQMAVYFDLNSDAIVIPATFDLSDVSEADVWQADRFFRGQATPDGHFYVYLKSDGLGLTLQMVSLPPQTSQRPILLAWNNRMNCGNNYVMLEIEEGDREQIRRYLLNLTLGCGE